MNLVVCVGLTIVSGAFAQEASSLPRFEVASIKRNTSNDPGSRNDLLAANVVFRNCELGRILGSAFDVDPVAMEGPAWLWDERFDITAKVPDPKASLAERRQMLQTLLMDRFGLAFHHETKTRAGFALVIAKNGPKIQPVPDEGGNLNDNRPGKMQRLRTTIDGFASAVSDLFRQPVVNETRMEGNYNVVLTYAPQRVRDVTPADDAGPSIFTAIEEQLGLKLEPRKVPVDILVIDRCQKMPTEN
jgi:uncharacterized protein (TIGR03435 family)